MTLTREGNGNDRIKMPFPMSHYGHETEYWKIPPTHGFSKHYKINSPTFHQNKKIKINDPTWCIRRPNCGPTDKKIE